MAQQICQEETTNSENRREQPVGCEDLSGELQGEPEGSQPTESKDDAEARKDFRSIQGDFICRHHNEPRVQLCVPKEETFPTPLKHIDRATYTNLVVLQEKRKDDYSNVDSTKFVRFLVRIHKVHVIERETSKGICVVREEADKT